MNFFEKLQRKYGRFAIQGLMRYFSILYAVGFALSLVNPYFYYRYLALDPAAVLRGELWRLVSFLIYPPTTSWFWGVFLLLMYYSLGNTLESVWGAFRFNVFMFTGIIFHIIAAFIVYFVTGQAIYLTPDNLNLSIFLAFALTFPEMQFYIYFVLPIKAKYLALFYGVMEGYAFLTGNVAERITIFLCLINLFLFFAWSGTIRRFSPQEIRRKAEFRQAMAEAQKGKGEHAGFSEKIVSVDRAAAVNRAPRHKCAVCGRTELDAPELEFRYCSKCNGDYEYCMEHLYTHAHVE